MQRPSPNRKEWGGFAKVGVNRKGWGQNAKKDLPPKRKEEGGVKMQMKICSWHDVVHGEQRCAYCKEFFQCGILRGRTCLWVHTDEDEKRATEGLAAMMRLGKTMREEARL